MKFHEAANIWPLMDDDKLNELAKDIKEHGLHHPVMTLDGAILDGRNRYRACLLAGVECRFQEIDPVPTDLPAWVYSENGHRRHATPSQLAMVAAAMKEYYAKQAKERQRAGGGDHGNQHTGGKKKPVPVNLPEPANKGDARDHAGAVVGVSGKLVDLATKVRTKGVPELAKAVKEGRLSVTMAANLTERDKETQKLVAEKAKFSQGKFRTPKLPKGSEGVTPQKINDTRRIATFVICHLERIREEDPDREYVFDKVTQWISKERKKHELQTASNKKL